MGEFASRSSDLASGDGQRAGAQSGTERASRNARSTSYFMASESMQSHAHVSIRPHTMSDAPVARAIHGPAAANAHTFLLAIDEDES